MSEKDIKEFYKKLGSKGLSELISDKRTKEYLTFLKKYLSKTQKILDLACGYGRLTIPLAKKSYKIEGIDLSPNLIQDAKKFAQKEKINIAFETGDMKSLPYKDNSFDAIICMWSSFNHLLTQKDQIKALKEMFRILNSNGLAIIDMPYFRKPTKKLLKAGKFLENDHLYQQIIGDLKNITYLHNTKTLKEILDKAKILNYEIKVKNIDKRRRLILYLYKTH